MQTEAFYCSTMQPLQNSNFKVYCSGLPDAIQAW